MKAADKRKALRLSLAKLVGTAMAVGIQRCADQVSELIDEIDASTEEESTDDN